MAIRPSPQRKDNVLAPRSGEVLAGWTPVRAPFSGLRHSLADAEAHLPLAATGEPGSRAWERWGCLQEAVGDPGAAAGAVDSLLGAVLPGWRLRQTAEGSWRVYLVPTVGVAAEELAAVQAVALLIEAGGWSRLGRCAALGCATVFLDINSGGNRRVCRAHQRDR